MFKPIAAVFVLLSLACLIAGGLAITAPSGNFTVTPDTVYFNWSNGTINISAGVDNITLIINRSIYLNQFYGQPAACGPLNVQNMTGDSTNVTETLNSTNWTLMFLTPNLGCSPGRYSGNYTIYNSANISDKINNLSAIIDVPMNENNSDVSGKTSAFSGSFTQNQSYHAYWFFTNFSQNLTGVTIKLTGLSADLDMFLVNSSDYNGNVSNLIDKSINRSTGTEEIPYIRLPDAGGLWAIIVYGNVSSLYNGTLYFNSLNISNASDGSPLQNLSLGSFDPNTSKSEIINISNIDDGVVLNANLDKQIWHVDNWLNNANPNSFSLLVPNFTQKLKIKVEWNGTGQWNMTLKDQTGNLIGNSSDRKVNVNASSIPAEEYVIYDGSFSSKEGMWNITVSNITNATGNYNVTAYLWLNASEWVATNFTNGFDFNSSGLENSSTVVMVNMTAPNKRLLNGTYGGFIELSNTSKTWRSRVPIDFSVNAGTLVINGNISTSTARQSWSIGYNATFPFNISMSNTGGYDVYYSYTSSGFLNHTSQSGKYMTFTVDAPAASGSIAAGASDFINLSVTLNTSQTSDTQGTYRGYIIFNTTNATINSSSYPYDFFNLTVEVVLTSGLIVNVTSISPNWVTNTSQNQNTTFGIQVTLPNGTIISNDSIMNYTNFTYISINDSNTSYGYILTGIKNKGTDPCLPDGNCYINATTPTGMVGGSYRAYASVIWYNGVYNLTGSGSSDSVLFVNSTGLYLSPSPTSFSMTSGSSATLNLSIWNYGPLAAAGSLTLGNCSSYITTSIAGAPCGYNPYNIGPNGTLCWFTWTITALNTSSGNCTFTITSSNNAFNSVSIPISVSLSAAAAAAQQQQQHSYQPALSITNYASTTSVILGGSNSSTVVVKNTGNLSANVKLNVSIDSGITVNVTPEMCTIPMGGNCPFTVTFTVHNTTSLGNHQGTYMAYVTTSASIYDSKSFTLTVRATESRQEELNVSYENYTDLFENLSAQLKAIEQSGLVSKSNLSKAEVLLNDSNATIAAIRAAIATGNWAEAERLITELSTNLGRLGDEISNLQTQKQAGEEAFWGSAWIWGVVAIVIIGVAAFVVYLLLPPRGGWHPTRGYRAPTEKPHKRLTEKLKNIFKRKGKGFAPV